MTIHPESPIGKALIDAAASVTEILTHDVSPKPEPEPRAPRSYVDQHMATRGGAFKTALVEAVRLIDKAHNPGEASRVLNEALAQERYLQGEALRRDGFTPDEIEELLV